jgi:sugar O-acyltransferase (sialic acid O-acetyltransferase NeuD family)
MPKTRKLILVGDSAFAEIAYEYFEADTDYEVVAFSVERAFIRQETLFGLPVVAFEDLESLFDASTHEVYVATVYTQLNRLRTRLARTAKAKGFRLASYVSPRAFVWRNVELGEHCFIFEDNTLQPFVKIGDNVVLWSGNHIGHHSIIRSNCFISSHVVISGFCDVGESTFLGVNSTLSNNISIGRDNWIGPGGVIMRNTKDGDFVPAKASEISAVSATRFFKIKE